ncbi:MAG: GGDEF domain-containing protein [Candidatus Latescibacteria bacterium]|nr:GGDEF domain-containing protein [Candidatus Latescibacterota bacterium]
MKIEKRITLLEDLSRVFLTTLKEMSSSGEKVTAKAISWHMEENDKTKKIIEKAFKGSDEKTSLESEKEIDKYKSKIDSLENDRKKFQHMVLDAEDQCRKETDYHKRFALTFLNMSRTQNNEPFFNLMDEYRNLLTENAELEQREKALSDIKNMILRSDVTSDQESNQGNSILKGIFNRNGNTTGDKKLIQLKNTCLKALSDLEKIFGNSNRETLLQIQENVRNSDDFDYLLSLRKDVIDLIRKFIDDIQSEKEDVTGFLKDIGEKLTSMGKHLTVTSDNTDKYNQEDFSFNETLEKEIKSVSDSFETANNIESLKSQVMSKLDYITHALKEKREEYIYRIEKSREEREELLKNFENMIESVKERNRILTEQSRMDPLTGIFNRRVFEIRIDDELTRYHRYKTPFSLIFFDIDHFKKINDTCGHEAGDKVLKAIAKRVNEMVRKPDLFARYGGEEFVVILPETDIKQSVDVAKKLRLGIEETEFEYENTKVPVTISVGVTEAKETDLQCQPIINRADSLMYTAKKRGRNIVVSDLDENGSAKEKSN